MLLNWLLIVQVIYSFQKINFQLVLNTTILGGVAHSTATRCVSSMNDVSCRRVRKNERSIVLYLNRCQMTDTHHVTRLCLSEQFGNNLVTWFGVVEEELTYTISLKLRETA